MYLFKTTGTVSNDAQYTDWRYYMQYKKNIDTQNHTLSIIQSVLSLGQSDFSARHT